MGFIEVWIKSGLSAEISQSGAGTPVTSMRRGKTQKITSKKNVTGPEVFAITHAKQTNGSEIWVYLSNPPSETLPNNVELHPHISRETSKPQNLGNKEVKKTLPRRFRTLSV